MEELSDRQVAHRRAMLEHLTQIARDPDRITVAQSTPSQSGGSGISIVQAAERVLTHRVAMDTIAMDER